MTIEFDLIILFITLAIGRLRRLVFIPQSVDISASGSNCDELPSECPKTKRNPALDALRGLAALQVIVTHVGSLISVPVGYTKITDSLTRYEVPLFLIISGALLARQPSQRFANFWGPKFKRTFLPYLICTTLIALYSGASWADFLHWIVTGKAAGPYYFVIVLLQCYVLIFLCPGFFSSKYCLPIGLLISFGCLGLGANFSYLLNPFFGGLFIYFCYGCCHSARLAVGRQLQGYAFRSAIIFLLVSLLAFIVLPNAFSNYGYLYPIAVFEILLVLVHSSRLQQITKGLNFLGGYSLWIFLVHFAVVKVVFSLFDLEKIPYFPGLVLLSVPLIFVSIVFAIISAKSYNIFWKITELRFNN